MINFDKNYISFNNFKINILIDKNNITWFNAKEIINMLGYKSSKDTLRDHVNKSDKQFLKHITTIFKNNNHPNSIYLNESGLYSLLLSSKFKIARDFRQWLTAEVIPALRKYGIYKLKNKYKKLLSKINSKIKHLEKQNLKLKNNLKSNKYPNGGLIYVLHLSDNLFKIGITNNLNKRTNTYNTGSADNVNIVFFKKVSCPIKIELCVKSLLYDYRYRNKREIYNCELPLIKKIIRKCISTEKCLSQSGGSIFDSVLNDFYLLKHKILHALSFL